MQMVIDIAKLLQTKRKRRWPWTYNQSEISYKYNISECVNGSNANFNPMVSSYQFLEIKEHLQKRTSKESIFNLQSFCKCPVNDTAS